MELSPSRVRPNLSQTILSKAAASRASIRSNLVRGRPRGDTPATATACITVHHRHCDSDRVELDFVPEAQAFAAGSHGAPESFFRAIEEGQAARADAAQLAF
jgi:hypothetical protein